MKLRSVRRPEDVTGLDHLFAIVTECDGHRPIGEHKYLDLLHGDPEREPGIVAEADGTIIAYAAVAQSSVEGTGAIEVAIHPLHRTEHVMRTLVEAAVARLAELGASRVRMWTFQPRFVGILESLGFEPERELRQVRRGLPTGIEAVLPDRIDVRGFLVGGDEVAWLEVNNAAFVGHPENGRWTMEVLRDREAQPWFDAEGFRMAWDGEALVGFCWTKMHSDRMGEIYVVAVAPNRQGRGLGRALVVEGLRYLSDCRGAKKAMLYVDADNIEARNLYEQLGFRLDHVDRSLVKAIV